MQTVWLNTYVWDVAVKTHSKLLLFLIFFVLSSNVANASDKFYQCREDSECTLIDVCAVAISVNKKYEDRAKRKLLKTNQICIAMVPKEFQTHKPVCTHNECSMAEMSLPASEEKCLSQKTDKERDYCLINLATINNDPILCEQVAGNSKEDCIQNILKQLERKKELDEKHCNGLMIGKFKDKCYLDLAKQQRNADMCFEISDKDIQSKCLISPSSRTNGDPYWIYMTSVTCELALDRGYRAWADDCYKNLESTTADNCNKIKAITPWYHCVRDLALKTNNLEICDSVSERKFPRNYPVRAYSVSACKTWASDRGNYMISE